MGVTSIENRDLGAATERLDLAALSIVRLIIGKLLRAPGRTVEALFRLSDAELRELLRHAEHVGREKGLSTATADDRAPAEPVPTGGLQTSYRSAVSASTPTVEGQRELDPFLGPVTSQERLWQKQLVLNKLLLNSAAMRAALGGISRQAMS